MKAVGFKFSAKKKGSRRHFVAIGETAEIYGKTPYVYHLVRDQTLCATSS